MPESPESPESPVQRVRVADLRVGQVMSLPGDTATPALICGISGPVGDSRMIELLDLESGEPRAKKFMLGVNRQVLVHLVVAEHHWYTNQTDGLIEVTLGARVERFEPRARVHYTGRARPDVFPAGQWVHKTTPVVAPRVDPV